MTFFHYGTTYLGKAIAFGLIALGIGLLFLKGVQQVTADVVPVDLSNSTLTVNRAEQGPGGNLTYTFTILKSDTGFEQVSASATLPTGLTLVSGSAKVDSINGSASQLSFGASGQTVSWSGDMLNGGQAVLSFRAMVDAGVAIGTILPTTAMVTSDSSSAVSLSAAVTVVDRPTGPTDVYLPFLTTVQLGLCYQERNGIVIIDVEDQKPNGWEFTQDKSGYAGDGYYVWPGGPDDILGRTDLGVMEFLINIDSPGNYFMRMHSYHKHPDPEKATEANDMYTSMDGGSFEKTVTWSFQWGKWGWATGREIHNGPTYNPPVFTLSKGIHVFKASARSSTFGIDRFAFYKQTLGANAAEDVLSPMPTSDLCAGYTPPVVDH